MYYLYQMISHYTSTVTIKYKKILSIIKYYIFFKDICFIWVYKEELGVSRANI